MISEKSTGFPKASEKERMMTNQNVNSSKIKKWIHKRLHSQLDTQIYFKYHDFQLSVTLIKLEDHRKWGLEQCVFWQVIKGDIFQKCMCLLHKYKDSLTSMYKF